MNIIELAKEMLQRKVYLGAMGFECTDAQLEAFATAIIENYKAGLVPVAWYKPNGNWYDGFILGATKLLKHVNSSSYTIPLYALGETK